MESAIRILTVHQIRIVAIASVRSNAPARRAVHRACMRRCDVGILPNCRRGDTAAENGYFNETKTDRIGSRIWSVARISADICHSEI